MGGRFSKIAPSSGGDVEMQQNPGEGGGGGGGGGGGPGGPGKSIPGKVYLVIGLSGVITMITVMWWNRDSHPPLAAAAPPMLPPLPAPMLPPLPLPPLPAPMLPPLPLPKP